MKLPLCLVTLCLTGCATLESGSPGLSHGRPASGATSDPYATTRPSFDSGPDIDPYPSVQSERKKQRPEWRAGVPLMQGFIGASFYEEVSREGGTTDDVDGDDGDLDQLPLIGGGAQFKLGGERLDYGFEAFFSLAGRANTAAFAVGGGGAVVAVDVDLLIVDLYGGPFVSTFLGDKLRVYGSVGPLLQFADYDQDVGATSQGGSGFGVGAYARTGIEFVLPSHTMIGIGLRWSDSTIDLDGGLGDLEIEGFQAAFTVSRGI